jgi:hypothetical protein
MKRLMMTAALAISACGVFAQGTITWNNGPANAISWAAGLPFTGPVAGAQGIKVGLYYNGASGYTLVSSTPYLGTLSSGATNVNVNGRWNTGAAVAVPGLPAGQTGTFQVRAWSGDFASYEAAVAGNALYGAGPGASVEAITFQNATGGVVDPVSGIPGAAAALALPAGQTVGTLGGVIPEPSTYALAGLGLGALLLMRRRK